MVHIEPPSGFLVPYRRIIPTILLSISAALVLLLDWRASPFGHVMVPLGVMACLIGLVLATLSQHRRQVLAQGLLSATYDAAGTGICVVDGNGRIVQANAAWVALCGRMEAELVQTPFSQLFQEEERRGADDLIRGARDREGPPPRSLTLYRADGGTRRVLATALSFTDASGRPLTVVSVNDVTDQERREERLHECNQRMRHMQRIAGTGWWTVDRATDRVVWSDSLY